MAAPLFAHPELSRLGEELRVVKERYAAACREAARIDRVGSYTFQTGAGPRTLSDLFGEKRDLIVVHNMGRACVYCTTWADGLSGLGAHLSDRAGFALSSPDPVEVQREFAASRGWRFPLVSTAGTTFAADMGFERDGKALPGFSAFTRDARGVISRVGASVFGPGDDFCALWPMMDQLRGGVDGWTPKYAY